MVYEKARWNQSIQDTKKKWTYPYLSHIKSTAENAAVYAVLLYISQNRMDFQKIKRPELRVKTSSLIISARYIPTYPSKD